MLCQRLWAFTDATQNNFRAMQTPEDAGKSSHRSVVRRTTYFMRSSHASSGTTCRFGLLDLCRHSCDRLCMTLMRLFRRSRTGASSSAGLLDAATDETGAAGCAGGNGRGAGVAGDVAPALRHGLRDHGALAGNTDSGCDALSRVRTTISRASVSILRPHGARHKPGVHPELCPRGQPSRAQRQPRCRASPQSHEGPKGRVRNGSGAPLAKAPHALGGEAGRAPNPALYASPGGSGALTPSRLP